MTTTLTFPVLFTITLTSLLALTGCVDQDDSGNKDSASCQNTADCPDDTGDPPASMQLAYEISELGVPLGSIMNTHLGDQSAYSGNATAEGTILTLPANKLSWLTAGDATRLVEGEVTPLFEDANGLWATMPKQLFFDDTVNELSIFSPTYDPDCDTGWDPTCLEAPLSVFPVPEGIMSLSANLNLWFDFGAAVCHYDNGEGGVGDMDQSDLVVKFAYQLDVVGVTDGNDLWIEVNGNALQFAGPGAERTILESTINQKDGIISFTTSAGESVICQ